MEVSFPDFTGTALLQLTFLSFPDFTGTALLQLTFLSFPDFSKTTRKVQGEISQSQSKSIYVLLAEN